MTTIRSFSGIDAERAFKREVLPLPVPPEMRMLLCSRTASCRNSMTSGDMLPRSTNDES